MGPIATAVGLVACTVPLPSGVHLPLAGIPAVVSYPAYVPAPPALPEGARYTLSVQEVPVREVLQALAEDAGLGLDVHPEVSGTLSLLVRHIPLPMLLERIARQAGLRYIQHDSHLEVLSDQPYVRSYRVDYPDLIRGTNSQTHIDTSATSADVSGSGSTDSNYSSTDILAESSYDFWEVLIRNLEALLDVSGEAGAIIPHPAAGVVMVQATAAQHQLVHAHLVEVLRSAHRQVMIRATIVEITLDQRFQAGIDWSLLDGDLDLDWLPGVPARAFSALRLNLQEGSLALTLRVLEELGETRVLSSPQLMVLNHQTAMLKVVDNLVYFTLEQQSTISVQGSSELSSSSDIHTVPVGLVMSLTPQIDARGNVLLLVRPSISRVNRFVEDPNPALVDGANRVPEVQVRELESLLRLRSGQTAVIGGLTRDEWREDRAGLPGLTAWFPGSETRESRRTELVVLLHTLPVSAPEPQLVAASTTMPLTALPGIAPHQVIPWLHVAHQAWSTGDTARAAEAWRRAITLDADNRYALYGLAAAALWQGRPGTARTWYQRLVALAPGDTTARAALAAVDGSTAAVLQRQLGQDASAPAFFILGNLYAAEQRWQDALAAYDMAMAALDRPGDCAFNMAVALEHIGDKTTAVARYQLALRLSGVQEIGFSAVVAEARITALEAAP